MNFVQTAILIVAMATEMLNFRIKCSKIFLSEAIKGMKLQLYIYVKDISLYINCVYNGCCPCGFVTMATLSFHRLIMGKVEIRMSYCRYFDYYHY